MSAKRALMARQRRAIGIPKYAAELRLVRGSCLARRKGKRCPSQHGIVRLSIDYTDRRSRETLATVECASCGHTWHRIKPPNLGAYQSTRLTLILPSDQRRWYARGRWHVEGEDAVILRDATWAELMSAAADWGKRNSAYATAVARKRAKAEAAATESHAATMATLASWQAKAEAEAEAERAAAEREAAS